METYTLIDGDGARHVVEDAGSGGGTARFVAMFVTAPPLPWRFLRGRDRQEFALSPRGQERALGVVVWVADVLPSGEPPPAEEADARECVGEALRFLPARQRRVVEMRFGLDGGEPLTLAKAGAVLGLSKERVRQVEQKALARLARVPGLEALAG